MTAFTAQADRRDPRRRTPRAGAIAALVALSAAVLMPATDAAGQGALPSVKPGETTITAERPPHELAGADLEDHLGQTIPLDAEFKDSTGKTVKLADYFDGETPVLLNLVYFECPNICTIALNGTIDAVRQLAWTPGAEYRVVTVSFNPAEGPELAAAKKASYMRLLDRPGAEKGWAFLTGQKADIDRLAEAVGFNYRWIPEQDAYSHAAALYVLSPEGVISRAIGGLMYQPETVRLALVEATDGKIGTFGDMLVMFCATYDPAQGGYVMVAMQVMKLGGALTVLLLAITLGLLWRWDRKRRNSIQRERAESDGEPQPV